MAKGLRMASIAPRHSSAVQRDAAPAEPGFLRLLPLLSLGLSLVALGLALALWFGAQGNADGRTASPGLVLCGIMLAGALGGVVDGLTSTRHYHLRFGTWSADLGSLGDALVGMTSGIALFTVAGALFGVAWERLGETEQLLKIAAWGVLSGFAGMRLLNPMTEAAVRRIAGEAVENAGKTGARERIEVSLLLRDAEREVLGWDLDRERRRAEGMPTEAALAEGRGLLEAAAARYDAVLALAPCQPEAVRGKAGVLRRLAELSGDEACWAEAIALLTGMIERRQAAALAHYDRARYRCLAGGEVREVLADLRAACEGHPELRACARTDPDFERLRRDGGEAFRALLH